MSPAMSDHDLSSQKSPATDGGFSLDQVLAQARTVEAKTKQQTVWDAIRSNPRIIALCTLLLFAPLLDGFDTICMNLSLSMPAFSQVFGVRNAAGTGYVIEASWQALWAALYQVGIAVGALCAAPISDRLGRRVGLGFGACVSAAGVSVVLQAYALSNPKGAFLGGKIVSGLGIGLLVSTTQAYASEIIPQVIRGPMLAAFTFFYVIGQLMAISIVHARVTILSPIAFRLPFALQFIWPSILLIGALIMPESPTLLVRKGRDEDAARSLRRLHGTSDIEARMSHIRVTLHEEAKARAGNVTYLSCFRGTNRRRTFIAMSITMLQQSCGTVFFSNTSYFLVLAGFTASRSVELTLISVALALPANLLSYFTMYRFGRRTLILFSTTVVFGIMLGVGIAGSVAQTTAALNAQGALLMVAPFVYNLGVGPLFPLIAQEVPSVELRAKTSSLSFFSFAAASAVMNEVFPLLYNPTGGAGWLGKSGFVFVVMLAFSIPAVYFFLPETKGRTYAEIDELFARRVSARHFSTTACEGHLAEAATAVDVREDIKDKV